MDDQKITAETIAKVAAQLGVKGPLPGSAKPRFPLPDIEIEDIPIGDKVHCRLHMVWEGRVIRSQNHTPGPELDALLSEAQKLGFQIIRGAKKRRAYF